MVYLTDKAVEKIKKLKTHKSKQNCGLRIGVIEDGYCQRDIYIGLQNNSSLKDTVYEIKGIKIFIDNYIIPLLRGGVLDFSQEPDEGFILKNSDIRGAGDCGKTFCFRNRF